MQIHFVISLLAIRTWHEWCNDCTSLYFYRGILILKFQRKAFNVKLPLSGVSRVEYWELSNISTRISVVILRVIPLLSIVVTPALKMEKVASPRSRLVRTNLDGAKIQTINFSLVYACRLQFLPPNVTLNLSVHCIAVVTEWNAVFRELNRRVPPLNSSNVGLSPIQLFVETPRP
jgi:hypothetical protein